MTWPITYTLMKMHLIHRQNAIVCKTNKNTNQMMLNNLNFHVQYKKNEMFGDFVQKNDENKFVVSWKTKESN